MKNIKIKTFCFSLSDDIDKKLNKFMKNKNVVDIKTTKVSSMLHIEYLLIQVIYQEGKDNAKK